MVNRSGWNFGLLSKVTTSYPFFLKTEAVDPVPENKSNIRRILGVLSVGGISVLGDRDLDGEGVFWRSADEDDAWSGTFERPRIGSDELPLSSDSICAGAGNVEVRLSFPLARLELDVTWVGSEDFESSSPIGTDCNLIATTLSRRATCVLFPSSDIPGMKTSTFSS